MLAKFGQQYIDTNNAAVSLITRDFIAGTDLINEEERIVFYCTHERHSSLGFQAQKLFIEPVFELHGH